MHDAGSVQLERLVHRVLRVIETLMVIVVSVLVLLAIAGLLAQVIAGLRPPFLAGSRLSDAISNVLTVLVLVELLATAAAYFRRDEVLRRLFETAFIAIVRKLITAELGPGMLDISIEIGILLVATGIAWWLVARATAAQR